ncbi:MAG: hypothetical protein LBO72_07300 [Helicobacteraceae bacterium]|jgi:transcriptional regulator with XRE-family HTH domain|nr:hypothetical protein [Helicobacteraceae bacterium]
MNKINYVMTEKGERVRRAREARKMNVDELSALSGVGYYELLLVEDRGHKIALTIDHIQAIAKALNVDIKYIMNGENEPLFITEFYDKYILKQAQDMVNKAMGEMHYSLKKFTDGFTDLLALNVEQKNREIGRLDAKIIIEKAQDEAKKIGKRLELARKARDRVLGFFALDLHMNVDDLAMIEGGAIIEPYFQTIEKIALYLRVDIHYILTGESEPQFITDYLKIKGEK